MPRPKKNATHPFDQLIQAAAEMLAGRLGGLMSAPAPRRGRPPGSGAKKASNGRRRSSALKGQKLDMTCRVEGCPNRSGGPRWGFICDMHRAKLSKKAQQAARDAWKAKQAA